MNRLETLSTPKEKPQSFRVKNGKESPIISEILETLQTIDGISQRLSQVQNGNFGDNLVALQVIFELSKTREQITKQFPELVWENPGGYLGVGEYALKPKTKKVQGGLAVPIPEGYLSVEEVCQMLGMTNKNWFAKIRNKYDLSLVRIGRRVFYKKEDIEEIATERQQNQQNRKVGRKAQFEKDFEGLVLDGESVDGEGLDLFGLHLTEIGKIPIEAEKHKVWGEKIQDGKLALLALAGLLQSANLTSSQREQIDKVLENGVSKSLLKHLQAAYSQHLAKSDERKDEADKIFIATFEQTCQQVANFLEEVKQVGIGEIAEHKLQDFIDQKVKILEEAFVARASLISANLKLVVSIAKKYRRFDMELADLEGYGQFGLITAVARWDFRKGYRFSTYAAWWIKQAIGRAIADFGDTIRLPIHVHEQISKLRKAEGKLLQETNSGLDFEDLANEIDRSGSLSKALKIRNAVSLNTPVGPERDSLIEDFLEDVKNNLEEVTEKIGLKDDLEQVLNTLPDREKLVLVLRYGLEDGVSRSLEQVALELARLGEKKITRERVRQIEEKALRKLRHPIRAKKLRPYLDEDPKSISTTGAKELNVRQRKVDLI